MEEDLSKKKRRGWRKWFSELFTKCFACCCGPLKRFLWGEAQSDDYAHFIDDDVIPLSLLSFISSSHPSSKSLFQLERGVTATPNIRERTPTSTNKTYSPPHPPLPTPKKKDTTSVNFHSTTILQEPPIQTKSMYSSQEIEDESSSLISNSSFG